MPSVLDFTSTPIYVGQQSDAQMFKVTNTGNVPIDNLMIRGRTPVTSPW